MIDLNNRMSINQYKYGMTRVHKRVHRNQWFNNICLPIIPFPLFALPYYISHERGFSQRAGPFAMYDRARFPPMRRYVAYVASSLIGWDPAQG